MEEEEEKKKKEKGGFVCETLQRSKVLSSWTGGVAIAIAVDIQIFSNLRIVTASSVESTF